MGQSEWIMTLWARRPGSEPQIYHFRLSDLRQVTSPLWAVVSEIWRGPYRIYSRLLQRLHQIVCTTAWGKCSTNSRHCSPLVCGSLGCSAFRGK